MDGSSKMFSISVAFGEKNMAPWHGTVWEDHEPKRRRDRNQRFRFWANMASEKERRFFCGLSLRKVAFPQVNSMLVSSNQQEDG